MKEKELVFKLVQDRPKIGVTKITTYYRIDGRVRKRVDIKPVKEYGRFL